MAIPGEGLGGAVCAGQREGVACGIVDGAWRLEYPGGTLTAATDGGIRIHAAGGIGSALAEGKRGCAIASGIVGVSVGWTSCSAGSGKNRIKGLALNFGSTRIV